MRYLLDSDTCIVFLNKRSEKLRQRFESCDPEQILLCSMVKAELFADAIKSPNPEQCLAKVEKFCGHFQSLPFDDNAAFAYGIIRAELAAKGETIGDGDFMTAIALANAVTLVTHKPHEFSQVGGLLLEDWAL